MATHKRKKRLRKNRHKNADMPLKRTAGMPVFY